MLLAFPGVFAFDQTGAIHGSGAYDEYAQNLLATGVYGRTPGVPDAAIPPLYSYVLAGVYGLFGRGYLQVGLFHILLDVCSILMLNQIAVRLMPKGEWVGALAGLFYALYPYLIFQNLTLIDTPFFMLLLNAFVLLMVLLRERPSLDRRTWMLAALGGIVLGLSVLARPITPPLAVLVALWFLFRLNLKQTILRLLPVALLSAAVLTPWIVRNDAVFGAFVPMTTTSGANFWQGNSPYTIPYFRAGYDVQWTSPDLTTADPNSREADAERFALAFQWLRDNPDKIPELLWVKFLVYWSIDVTPRLNPAEGELPRLDYQGNVDRGRRRERRPRTGRTAAGRPGGRILQPLFDQIGRTIHRFYWGGCCCWGWSASCCTPAPVAGGVAAVVRADQHDAGLSGVSSLDALPRPHRSAAVSVLGLCAGVAGMWWRSRRQNRPQRLNGGRGEQAVDLTANASSTNQITCRSVENSLLYA